MPVQPTKPMTVHLTPELRDRLDRYVQESNARAKLHHPLRWYVSVAIDEYLSKHGFPREEAEDEA